MFRIILHKKFSLNLKPQQKKSHDIKKKKIKNKYDVKKSYDGKSLSCIYLQKCIIKVIFKQKG